MRFQPNELEGFKILRDISFFWLNSKTSLRKKNSSTTLTGKLRNDQKFENVYIYRDLTSSKRTQQYHLGVRKRELESCKPWAVFKIKRGEFMRKSD